MKLNPVVEEVTQRIGKRSRFERQEYLLQIQRCRQRPHYTDRLACSNIAHCEASHPPKGTIRIVPDSRVSNIAIVSAYNDMVSAHTPYGDYPNLIKQEAVLNGARALVAGGVPAMCDGVTQGEAGMELSLLSRDTIAMGAAIALSHDVFDAALMLGVCDKIVPGLLIGALHFGHLPTVFVPSGPMQSGGVHVDKAAFRQQAAQGKITRSQLLQAEMASYQGPGTCTFYGTANTNQMLLQAMGLQLPGAAFVAPQGPLREALTRSAVRCCISDGCPPIGQLVDERSIVNAIVVLLATGGSTNHLIHWVAVARAARLRIDWDDFADLARVVPLLARIYPNGKEDVNRFNEAHGPSIVFQQLLEAGLLHPDALSVWPGGPVEQTRIAQLDAQGQLHFSEPIIEGKNLMIASMNAPFSPAGGLMVLKGNLGRSVIKVSAVPDDHRVIQAPAFIFDSQQALLNAFEGGKLDCDCVCVVRWQGPRANGMPELHKLTPALGVLQDKGFKVALVTDGRMSGASGKIPAAIHLCPEGLGGGPIAKLRDGDCILLDSISGALNALVPEDQWNARQAAQMPESSMHNSGQGMGRELFTNMRRNITSAEEGACTWL